MEKKENSSPLANLYQISIKLCRIGVGAYLLQAADDVVGALLVLVLFLPSAGGGDACGLGQAGGGWAGLLCLVYRPRILFPCGLCAFKCDIRSRRSRRVLRRRLWRTGLGRRLGATEAGGTPCSGGGAGTAEILGLGGADRGALRGGAIEGRECRGRGGWRGAVSAGGRCGRGGWRGGDGRWDRFLGGRGRGTLEGRDE